MLFLAPDCSSSFPAFGRRESGLLPENLDKTLAHLITALCFKSRGPTHLNKNFLAWTCFAGKHYEATDPSDLLKAKTRVAERILHAFAEIKAANSSDRNNNHIIAFCVEREAIREVLSSLKPEDIQLLVKNPIASEAQVPCVDEDLYGKSGFRSFLRKNALSILAQLKPGSENYVYEKIIRENGKKRFTARGMMCIPKIILLIDKLRCYIIILVTVDGVEYVAESTNSSLRAGNVAARKAIKSLNTSGRPTYFITLVRCKRHW